MLSLQILEALDVRLWLGSGRHAASWLRCDESTISRHCRVACRTFMLANLKEARLELETGTHNQPPWGRLLLQERRVHQQARLLHGGRLRIHSNQLRSGTDHAGFWHGNLPYGRDCSTTTLHRLLETAILDAALVDHDAALLDHLDTPTHDSGATQLIRLPAGRRHTLILNRTVASHALALQDLQQMLARQQISAAPFSPTAPISHTSSPAVPAAQSSHALQNSLAPLRTLVGSGNQRPGRLNEPHEQHADGSTRAAVNRKLLVNLF